MLRSAYFRALRGSMTIPPLRPLGNNPGRYHNQLRQKSTCRKLHTGERNCIILATVSTIGCMTGIQKSCFASCETNENQFDKKENAGKRQANGSNASVEKVETRDLYDHLPDEDEPTTCTICLINRQGPCRPHWRKFERCMKDNSPNDGDDEEEKGESPSMSEKCDQYMLPWIRCIQKYRNRYTLISNAFFQKEIIEEIEKSVEENEKFLLDNMDLPSIVQIGSEWNSCQVDANEVISGKQESEVAPVSSPEQEDAVDDILVEGVARINMWDRNGDRQIEIAYVKDQDGALLGHDQFFDFKKSIKEFEHDNHVENTEKESTIGKVGVCNFHVNPSTTQSIQIFALYRGKDEVTEGKDNVVNDENVKQAEEKDKTRNQALFYSPLISMNDVPVQSKVEQDTQSEDHTDVSESNTKDS